jgi:glutaredoxin
MPYSVQQAVKNFPVTLWVFDCGEPCAHARSHLARRGIPHTERDARKEAAALQQATGSLEVPVLFVGATRLTGYLEPEWDAALDRAGYPRGNPTARATK